jgi:uncharacterized protein YwqG
LSAPSTVEGWKRFLLERQFAPAIAEQWAATALPYVRLIPGPPEQEDQSPTGASKIGGLPDLAPGATWPRRPAYAYPNDGRFRDPEASGPAPLSLLAQINLADLSAYEIDLDLPQAGLLLFFFDIECQPWGFDPSDAPGTQVIYVPPGQKLERAPHPDGRALSMRSLRFAQGQSLVSPEWILEALRGNISLDEQYDLEVALEALSDENYELMTCGDHIMGGRAAEVQGSMELECQLVTNGIYCGDSNGYHSDKAKTLAPGAADWRLILQLDSDDEAEWMWGDAGRLYFWCREQDIAGHRFDKIWTVLQCF